MTDSIMLEILKDIQSRITNIESTLAAMRSEIDGAFHMMRGTDSRIEGLATIVAAQGRRITALERTK